MFFAIFDKSKFRIIFSVRILTEKGFR